MNDKLFEEAISISYLRAIAAQAEITFELRDRDEDGKDADLSKLTTNDDGDPFNAEFSVQLKATCSPKTYSETDTTIKYALKAKNYNDLCKKGTNIIILALLVLPEDKSEWVTQSWEELVLKKCMYWASFVGKPLTDNTSTITVEIPKKNLLTAQTLTDMIHTIANGGAII